MQAMIARILLHLHSPCRSWQEVRFHATGILREFVPQKWQQFIR